MQFGKNILLLVPHPDDEVVGCMATIGRAQAEGAQIFALYVTHGCIARETMWPWQRRRYNDFVAIRRAEAQMLAALLKIKQLNDETNWPTLPARHLWRNMQAVFEKIRQAVIDNQIDQIWTPAFEGGNADHDALNAIASLFKKSLSVVEFAEYNFNNGKTHSQDFPFPNGTEQILNLTPEERVQKRVALTLYQSEKMNLNYVVCEREAYRPLADYQYDDVPHKGTLWYARFQWVPFRHPRVDFTNPRDAASAISAFLKANALLEFAMPPSQGQK